MISIPISRFWPALILAVLLGGSAALAEQIDNRSYTCHVAEETRDGVQIKSWTSDKIPGGLVKMELRGEGTLMTTLLVESSIQK